MFRLKPLDGCWLPPHTHPKPERVIVLSGAFHLGMGTTIDVRRGKAIPAGTYGTWPAGMKHFVWAEGVTVLRFHGEVPWATEHVSPGDDPRGKR